MQRVFIVPHEPRWAEQFAEEAAAVGRAMGEALIAIHHIGSTAIPGICAKPIIDLLAVVSDLDQLDVQNPHMHELGYEVMGEFGIAGRRYFRKDDASGNRTHQIHAFLTGSPQIARHVNFRDFLRAHREYADQYDALKQHLASLYPSDIAAYTDGKDEFIKEMDAKAAVWRVSVPLS